MSVEAALTALAHGRRSGSLLHTARLQAFGEEAYGEEAILEALRLHGADWQDAELVLGSGHAVLLGETAALFADMTDGLVARLWRVGLGAGERTAFAMTVPFDADLAQARGDVFARAADHPGLGDAQLAVIAEDGREMLSTQTGLRNRAFLIRAFAGEADAVGLFAIHGIGPGPVRETSLRYGLTVRSGGILRIYVDS